MGRGGAAKTRSAPERRCVATGESGETGPMIRFVLDPDGAVTPDLAEKLPGRGVWVTARRAALEKAVAKKLFARGFRAPALAPSDLPAQVERLLARRAVDGVSLCRKAGQAVAGYERVREALERAQWDGPESAERVVGAVLLQAFDGADGGKRKLARMMGEGRVLSPLSKAELGLAFGRPYVIHAALIDGGAARRAIRDLKRLEVLRDGGGLDGSGEPNTTEGA